jgi:phosphocarrier protein FPr
LYKIAAAGIPLRRISDPQAEWLRFQRAVGRVVKQTREMKVRILEKSGEYEASIFDAHLLSIEDPALCEAVRKGVYGEKISAEYVWSRAVDQMISDYEAVEDRYIRSRASDLADIKTWVLRALLGKSMEVFRLKVPGVIVARDLSPSEIARLNIGRVRGICTAYGNANSHAAILARALNIPAVVGVGIDLLRIAPGSVLVVRGDEGRITVNPKDLQVYKRKRSQWLLSLKKETQSVKKKAITIDGRRVRMAANIGGPFEVRSAVERGAEEIGILRTEFLFLERTTAPSEEEQVAVYRDIARRLGKRTLIIRTLDAGGDKPLPYIVQRKEQNPYLGVRGIRLSLNNPELFKAQLRAILRASAGNTMKIMLPMVSSVDEVRLTREMLEALKKDCRTEGVLFDENLDLGIMVEVPSAVIVAERLASEVSFFSIGTNDLCQYVMAADRSNERLATLYDALHPAVLRLVRQTVEAGHAAGIWVSVCGEIAGDRTAAPVLVGLGVDELSMQPQAIPSIKRIISSLTLTGAKKIAQEVLGFDSAVQVRQYIESRAFL